MISSLYDYCAEVNSTYTNADTQQRQTTAFSKNADTLQTQTALIHKIAEMSQTQTDCRKACPFNSGRDGFS